MPRGEDRENTLFRVILAQNGYFLAGKFAQFYPKPHASDWPYDFPSSAAIVCFSSKR